MTNVYLENYATLPFWRFCLLASRKFKLREIDAIFWQKKTRSIASEEQVLGKDPL